MNGFIVSDERGNPNTLFGLPVIEVSRIENKANDISVYIGIKKEKYADEAYRTLCQYGFRIIDNPVVEL